jgi:hypothetical protein
MSIPVSVPGPVLRLGRLAVLILALGGHWAGAATYTVTSTNDTGTGTLRQAITSANNSGVSNFIAFNLTGTGPFTINISNALPALGAVMTIDATTQPGYAGTPRVFVNGLRAGSGGVHGFDVQYPGCTIRGLAIGNFSGDGIRLDTVGTVFGGSDIIQANFIGTGVYGTNGAPNGWNGSDYSGIGVYSPNNLIGGIDASNRNVISGNTNYGILIDNSAPSLAAGNNYNIIQGNLIGTDVTGTKAVSNRLNGIELVMSVSNTIGGAVSGAKNVISGNGQCGIYLTTGSGYNVVQGNYIGVNAAGTAAIANLQDGIDLNFIPSIGSLAPDYNLIGGTSALARNIISGNSQRGIYIANPVNSSGSGLTTSNTVAGNYIGVSSNGLAKIPNGYSGVEINEAWYNTVGGTNPAAGNVISGNGQGGVKIGEVNATGNLVQNNLIGLAANGTNALGNTQNGVFLYTVTNNLIGPGNVISGNGFNGIYISNKTANAIIQGNYIGTDVTGLHSVGNALSGLWLTTAGSTIGGATAGSGNVIAGNTNNGIVFFGTGASNNLVLGNFIGTDATGTNPLANSFDGIAITNAPGNTIGGTTAPARNVISGNICNGIDIMSGNALNTVVQGNYIGTDATGTKALGNGLFGTVSANFSGISIANTPNTTIGGATSAARNVISGNGFTAVSIRGPGATNNLIEGNYIGTDVSGTAALPNASSGQANGDSGGGVDISGAPGNRIGGGAAGPGNLISGNNRDAIALGEAGTSNTVVQGNWIGVASDGHTPLPNAYFGLEARTSGGVSHTVIGGVNPGESNLIANANANTYSGIRIRAGNNTILVRGNSIYSNGGTAGFGIFLGPWQAGALTPNNSGWQNYPLLSAATAGAGGTTVTGTLGSAPGSYLVQFYANAITNGNVQGQFFLGDATVTTGANSNASFTVTLPAAVPGGQIITATAVDANNNTSELSPGIMVSAVVVPPVLNSAATFAGDGTPLLTFSWPTNAGAFTLLQATNLVPPVVWSPVTDAVSVVDTNNSVTITATNASVYYRLKE